MIGSMNPKAGCAGSVLNLLQIAGFNHQVKIVQGVCQEECSVMLSDFFKELREKKKRKNWRRVLFIRRKEKEKGRTLFSVSVFCIQDGMQT